MKSSILMAIYSVLALVAGTMCVLIPEQLLAGFGVSLTPMGLVIYQFWGAALIGLGLMAWFARNITDPVRQRKFALALFITNALSCIMAVRGQFAGANAAGWSNVALFFVLTAGFGVLTLSKPRV